MAEILIMATIGGVAGAFLTGGGYWLQQRWDAEAKDKEIHRAAEEKLNFSPNLNVKLYPDPATTLGPYRPTLSRYDLIIQNINEKSVPVLDLRIEFIFGNPITKIQSTVMPESGQRLTVGSLELHQQNPDESQLSYEYKPTNNALERKFSLEISMLSVGAQPINTNVANLYVEKWPERVAFIAKAILDLSIAPPFKKLQTRWDHIVECIFMRSMEGSFQKQ